MNLRRASAGLSIAALVVSGRPAISPGRTNAAPPARLLAEQRTGGDRRAPFASVELPIPAVQLAIRSPLTATMAYTVYVPTASSPFTCPQISAATFEAIAFQGGPYKDNRLTDENADFRMSILGFTPKAGAYLGFVSYDGGSGNGDAPRFHTMFTPARVPAFVQVYTINQWDWNESGPPPYGSQGAPNSDWDGNTVLDLQTTIGEPIDIPTRTASIAADYKALALYVSERELTLVYLPYDQVLIYGNGGYVGYVVHMLNFCVDPNLVALYRAQLADGKRATMKLPAIRGNQRVGWALGDAITVAIRDAARYMDPRVETDWWSGHP